MNDSEVELKFSLQPQAIAAVAAHPILQAAAAQDEQTLASTYFDTNRHDLRKARYACRIRDESGRKVQTVKGPTTAMAERGEWERDVAAATPDLARVPLPHALRKAIADRPLVRVFDVNVERRIWSIGWRASLIEAALDTGWILAEGRSAKVSELELELKDGDPRDLFDLARQLCADLPLDLDLRSKAQRGWMLKDGAQDPAPAPLLHADTAFADGFTLLAQVCVEDVASHALALRDKRDGDAVHDMRTAVRKLRAVLRVFRRRIRDKDFDALTDGLKTLSQALGAARDLDVAGERLGIAPALAARRDAAYTRIFDALDAPETRRLLVDLVDWLSTGDWRQTRRGAFAAVAAREFGRWDKRLRKAARVFDKLDTDERHALRLRAKNLVYCTQLTASLAPRGARKPHRAYVKALKAVQSRLGDLNDVRVGAALLDEIGPDTTEALRDAARRNRRKRKAREDHARKALALLLDTPPPFHTD